MNSTPKFRYARLTALCAALGFATLASAQTTVTTVPVGAVGYIFSQGSQLVGLSLVKNTITAANVSAVSGSSLTLSLANVGAVLTSGTAYYIEVVNDVPNNALYEGDRIEVDTAATIAANNNTIVVKNHAENTLSSALPISLSGTKIAIRRHLTLGGLLSELPGAFIPGDKITIRKDGTSYVTGTLNSAATDWRAGLASLNAVAIYPGVGFFLIRAASTSTSSALTGDLRDNNFVQLLAQGNQVIAEGYPLDGAASPAISLPAIGGTPNRLFTNSSGCNFLSGDKLTAYNDSNQLVTYTYTTSTNRWMAGLTNGNSIKLFKANKAGYLTVSNANQTYVQIKPFTL